MIDGLLAFIFLAIVVCFFLGMARPGVVLPPILLRLLEPGTSKPTRKMVTQWTCIGLVLLFAISLFVVPHDQKSYTADSLSKNIVSNHDIEKARKELLDLSKEMQQTADTTDSVECKNQLVKDVEKMILIAKQILLVERMARDERDGTIPALADIRNRISVIAKNQKKIGC